MPTQRGMSSFTGWKPEAGELMREKKDRERFSIKFNENDPAHEAVIRLLEKQGPHRKAQFIVNAVLHYVNCKEAPDISPAQAADRTSIEKIVMEVLSRKEGGQQDRGNAAYFGKEIREEQAPAGQEPEQGIGQEQKEVGEAAWAMIADTMAAFRNS